MRRWIDDIVGFLLWLGVLTLAKLLLVLFVLAEAVGMIVLCVYSVSWWQESDRSAYLLLPLAAMSVVALQWVLWQFVWLRVAQSGPRGRALGEYFAISLRHPVVRPPHPWE